MLQIGTELQKEGPAIFARLKKRIDRNYDCQRLHIDR